MNLQQLISKLQSLQNDHGGDIRVLTRGSQSTTMVGAEEVRIVKLKSGGAGVFVGKPKADRNND